MKLFAMLFCALFGPAVLSVPALAAPDAQGIRSWGMFFLGFLFVMALIYLLLLAVGWIGRRYGKTPPGGAPDGDVKGSKL